MGKFCGDCGHRLEVETPIEERPNPSAESERKHVTILFSDLSGYTAMSEKLDSEEVKEIMGRIFGEISKIIVRRSTPEVWSRAIQEIFFAAKNE